jgi:hypothetical protein
MPFIIPSVKCVSSVLYIGILLQSCSFFFPGLDVYIVSNSFHNKRQICASLTQPIGIHYIVLYFIISFVVRHMPFRIFSCRHVREVIELGVCELMYVIYCWGSDFSRLAPMFLPILLSPTRAHTHTHTHTHGLVQTFGCDGTILLRSTRSSGTNNALRPHGTSYWFHLLSILSILHKTIVWLSMKQW